MKRRTLLAGLGYAATVGVLGLPARPVRADPLDGASLRAETEALEARSGGRLGVAVLEIGSGRSWSIRGDERFPMCSTFKTPLAAAVLARIDRGEESPTRTVAVTAADVVVNSPLVQSRVGGSASVADLCEATVALSDNGAANLLLATIGGPAGLTRFLRGLGDDATRLDRFEPDLNESAPGDPRDTTTPDAMARSVARLLFEDALEPASRALIARWMIDSRTGLSRLRAGLPGDWLAGDKTGGGENGTTNNVAVGWPPERAPVVIACYLTQSRLDLDGRNAIHADVARTVAAALG